MAIGLIGHWKSMSKQQLKDWKNRLKEELSKCVMVCANCHISIHHEERGNE